MRTAWAIGLLLGCGQALHPEAPARSPDGILEWAARRGGPDPVLARLDLHLLSPQFSGATNGVLVADPPGRTHLAVLGLFGSPVLTATLDDAGLTLDLPQEHRRMVAPDAAGVVTEVSQGALSPGDLSALLLGQLPWAAVEPIRKHKQPDGAVSATWAGPSGMLVSAVIDPDTGCPRELDATLAGRTAVSARWEPFEELTLGDQRWYVPTRVALTLPDGELTIRYHGWKIPDPLPPVFDTPVPDGVTVEPLAHNGPGLGISALLGGMSPAP
jgi:hypothetical protein